MAHLSVDCKWIYIKSLGVGREGFWLISQRVKSGHLWRGLFSLLLFWTVPHIDSKAHALRLLCVCVCVGGGGGMFWWIHSDLLVLFYSKSHGYASFTLIPDIKIIALRRRCCGCSIMTRRRDESRSKSNLLNIKQWSSKECWEIHFQLRSNSRATGNSHKNN